jgi:hypothetical protein
MVSVNQIVKGVKENERFLFCLFQFGFVDVFVVVVVIQPFV